MLKPSELSPACSELMQQMVAEFFDEDLAYVAVGGLYLARAFSALPLDHLLYTGSSNVGKQIYGRGGEEPDAGDAGAWRQVPGGVSAGKCNRRSGEHGRRREEHQERTVCVSVDHCFVPRAEVDNFARMATEFMAAAMPGYARSQACTGIISDRHLDRIGDNAG